MSRFFPPPSINPFERFQPSDGILINAERWDKAHKYHRKRQNFHYQSLHQPGIVCGLGVKIIPTQGDEPIQYRDGRGVQLQPGLAIDLYGNPIVVPQKENIQIAVESLSDDPLTIYLVVSYRDPDELAISGQQEMVKEQFRIDVKTQPPNELEVEVCRLLLPPKTPVQLEPTPDVFFPGYYNLDFRFRNLATLRTQGVIRIAQIRDIDPSALRNFPNLDYLLKATEALYPKLQGIEPVELVSWDWENLNEYTLLYLSAQELNLNYQELEALKQYLAEGGVLLVDAEKDSSPINSYIASLAQQELGNPLKPLNKRHPLRRNPFLFAAMPNRTEERPIKLLVGGGIILSVGNLASLWGLDEELTLSRESIRSGQELGVNILYYAWQRRMMMSLH